MVGCNRGTENEKMNLRHKAIRLLEQPLGVFDLVQGIKPTYTQYFQTVKKFTPRINTYIDVGANVGDVIRAGRKVFPMAKIVAIEPIKEHCDEIKRLDIFTKVFNIGLWNENTKQNFWIVKDNDVESSFLKPLNEKEEDMGQREVELRRFDSLFITIKRPCFVKIDVEGAEFQVLQGFGNRLSEVDFVQLEQTHSCKNKDKTKMSKCIEILENFGFTGFLQVNTTFNPNGFPDKSDLIFFKTKCNTE